MSGLAPIAAIVALLPAMAGAPIAPGRQQTDPIVMLTCFGANIAIPGERAPAPADGRPCCAKGCHAASDRKKRLIERNDD